MCCVCSKCHNPRFVFMYFQIVKGSSIAAFFIQTFVLVGMRLKVFLRACLHVYKMHAPTPLKYTLYNAPGAP